jgi:hypothetical protein
VAEIVADCTDSWVEPKPPWRARKDAYIAAISDKPATSLLVSLADKTHNARAIVADLASIGDELWERFSQGPSDVKWYYQALADAFLRSLPGPLANEFKRTIEAMAQFTVTRGHRDSL